jgi:hypothetical protein
VEAPRQHVLEEAAHERLAAEPADAPAAGLAVAVRESHAGGVEADDAGVGDGDVEDVAGECRTLVSMPSAPGGLAVGVLCGLRPGAMLNLLGTAAGRVEQRTNIRPDRFSQDRHRIERRVLLAALDAGDVRLSDPCQTCDLDLRHAGCGASDLEVRREREAQRLALTVHPRRQTVLVSQSGLSLRHESAVSCHESCLLLADLREIFHRLAALAPVSSRDSPALCHGRSGNHL